MTTPSALADLVRATAAADALDERPGLLIVRAALADAALRERWRAAKADPPADVLSITITEADGDAELDDAAAPAADELFRITVQTRAEPGKLRLFLASSLVRAAAILPEVGEVLIAQMGANETFTTYRNRVQLWTNTPPEDYAAHEPLPDPRAYANDFTGGREVPADIRPWLLRTGPAAAGTVYEAWSAVAARRQMAALSNRVSRGDAGLSYHFNGPPACVATPSDAEVAALAPRLQAGVAWVFSENRDADTRHLLLTAEWARTHRRSQLRDLGEGALESAKAAYAAYVTSGSKETLKALAELRKAVVDEGQKTSQRAQDLAGAMWKDVAVAAAPFVLKILPDASRAPNAVLTIALALSAAAFLVFSFGIQVFINERYFRRQAEGRALWKRELNVALRQKDVDDLSEEPIRNSLADYAKVRGVVGLVYVGLVVALLLFAAANVPAGTGPAASKPAAPHPAGAAALAPSLKRPASMHPAKSPPSARVPSSTATGGSPR